MKKFFKLDFCFIIFTIAFAFVMFFANNITKVNAADTTRPLLYFSDFQDEQGAVYEDEENTVISVGQGGGFILTFEDETGLKYYNNTSYYRYQWCYNYAADYQECPDPLEGYEDWTAISSSQRTAKKIEAVLYWPLITQGNLYLWIEGDVTDTSGNIFSTDCTGTASAAPSSTQFKRITKGFPIAFNSFAARSSAPS